MNRTTKRLKITAQFDSDEEDNPETSHLASTTQTVGSPDDHFLAIDHALNQAENSRVNRRSTVIQKVLTYKNVKGFSKIENITDIYKWRKELGRGSFGVVNEAFHLKAKTPVAIKVVNKAKISAVPIYEKLMR